MDKHFKSTNGLELVIESKKSSIVFKLPDNFSSQNYYFVLDIELFNDFIDYITSAAYKVWLNLNPK